MELKYIHLKTIMTTKKNVIGLPVLINEKIHGYPMIYHSFIRMYVYIICCMNVHTRIHTVVYIHANTRNYINKQIISLLKYKYKYF